MRDRVYQEMWFIATFLLRRLVEYLFDKFNESHVIKFDYKIDTYPYPGWLRKKMCSMTTGFKTTSPDLEANVNQMLYTAG